jgi:hypothetical protein
MARTFVGMPISSRDVGRCGEYTIDKRPLGKGGSADAVRVLGPQALVIKRARVDRPNEIAEHQSYLRDEADHIERLTEDRVFAGEGADLFVDEANGQLCLPLPYTGTSLDKIGFRVCEPAIAAEIVVKICHELGTLHFAETTHSDVCIGNVTVEQCDNRSSGPLSAEETIRAKLIDFSQCGEFAPSEDLELAGDLGRELMRDMGQPSHEVNGVFERAVDGEFRANASAMIDALLPLTRPEFAQRFAEERARK